MALQVGIVGGSGENLPPDKADAINKTAEQVGFALAKAGAIIITGGQDGVMESAARGAKLGGGITVGTPGRKRGQCNKYIDIEICTPIDVGDYLFAGILSCDAIVVFPGGAGTFAEVYLAYRNKIPLFVFRGLDVWCDSLLDRPVDQSGKPEPVAVSSVDDCVAKITNLS